MANRVIWSAHAVSDVEAIARYIEADSPAYARSVVKKITASVHQLSQFPRSGREVPEFEDPCIRELIVYSYRVIYRITDSEILVVAMIHGKRNLR
ncbi:MAG TPA: type II toxin-antitoxin system RelE/ParE family toxin [Candidatus Angelobacter sp.]|nr:type II toxin-antitoxin system RelE/ParE family toxin [Candidatus Angelobacter sp.]